MKKEVEPKPIIKYNLKNSDYANTRYLTDASLKRNQKQQQRQRWLFKEEM